MNETGGFFHAVKPKKNRLQSDGYTKGKEKFVRKYIANQHLCGLIISHREKNYNDINCHLHAQFLLKTGSGKQAENVIRMSGYVIAE